VKVTYRANGETRDLSEAAARQLIEAGICDAVAEREPEPPPRRKAR
jgi:hypothetical protein